MQKIKDCDLDDRQSTETFSFLDAFHTFSPLNWVSSCPNPTRARTMPFGFGALKSFASSAVSAATNVANEAAKVAEQAATAAASTVQVIVYGRPFIFLGGGGGGQQVSQLN